MACYNQNWIMGVWSLIVLIFEIFWSVVKVLCWTSGFLVYKDISVLSVNASKVETLIFCSFAVFWWEITKTELDCRFAFQSWYLWVEHFMGIWMIKFICHALIHCKMLCLQNFVYDFLYLVQYMYLIVTLLTFDLVI